jgi:hypothetical protein
METPRPIRLPAAVAAAREKDLVEVLAAIELVARHAATRVTLAGLRDATAIAAEGLVHAQAANVRFALSRDPETDAISVVVGPPPE